MPGKSFMEQRFTTSVARAFFHATTAGARARHAKGSHRYARPVLLHSIIVESQYNNQNLPTRRRFVAYSRLLNVSLCLIPGKQDEETTRARFSH